MLAFCETSLTQTGILRVTSTVVSIKQKLLAHLKAVLSDKSLTPHRKK